MSSNHYKNFINNITPEHLKNKKFLNDCIDIYTKIIQNYSPYPSTVIFNNDKQKIIPKQDILNAYIKYITSTIQSSLENPSVVQALTLQGLANTDTNLDKMLDLKILPLSRDLKTTKGLAIGIENIYKVILNAKIQKLIADPGILVLDKAPDDPLAEVKPFEFYVLASMQGTLYNATVAKLSHPVGFKVNYKIEKKVPNLIETVYDLEDEFVISANTILMWADPLELNRRIKGDFNIEDDYIPNREGADQLDNKIKDDFIFEFDTTTHINTDIDLTFDDNVSQKHIVQWDL